MNQASTVLILGATGRLGTACAQAFAAAGWRVIAQQRRPARAPVAGIETRVTGDTPLVQALAGLPRLDVVVHAMNPAYTDAAWAQHAPGMMSDAIELASAHGATLMLPGNVYNFGAQMPAVLREDAPMRPTTAKGRIRVALEQQLQVAAKSGRLRGVVIRAGDFFGSGSGTWFDKLIVSRLAAGTMTYPGALDIATPWAYLPDLAQTFVKVAQRRQALAAFETLHFAGHNLTGQDWLNALQPIAEAQGWVKPGRLLKAAKLPWPVIRVGALFNPQWASLVALRYLYQTPHALQGKRLADITGGEPHTPLDLAVTRSLAELGMLSAAPAVPVLSH